MNVFIFEVLENIYLFSREVIFRLLTVFLRVHDVKHYITPDIQCK